MLEKLSILDALNLRRNYDWKVLSQADQKHTESQITSEYKYSIMDPTRTAALFERTQSIFKLLMQAQLNKKIQYIKD